MQEATYVTLYRDGVPIYATFHWQDFELEEALSKVKREGDVLHFFDGYAGFSNTFYFNDEEPFEIVTV